MAKKINKSAKTGQIVSETFAGENPETTFATEVEVPKKTKKPTEAEVVIPETQVMGGTYKLSALMVMLGFPAFTHDAARLFEKGIVSVNGEAVYADADYEVGNLVIGKDDQQFRVVGLVLTVPK